MGEMPILVLRGLQKAKILQKFRNIFAKNGKIWDNSLGVKFSSLLFTTTKTFRPCLVPRHSTWLWCWFFNLKTSARTALAYETFLLSVTSSTISFKWNFHQLEHCSCLLLLNAKLTNTLLLLDSRQMRIQIFVFYNNKFMMISLKKAGVRIGEIQLV